MEVSWPSGAKQEFSDVPADFTYTIVERQGVKEKVAFSRQ